MHTLCTIGPSCHHCRASHIRCDGGRPCSNCVRRSKECFNYDSLLYHQSSLGLLNRTQLDNSSMNNNNAASSSSSSNSGGMHLNTLGMYHQSSSGGLNSSTPSPSSTPTNMNHMYQMDDCNSSSNSNNNHSNSHSSGSGSLSNFSLFNNLNLLTNSNHNNHHNHHSHSSDNTQNIVQHNNRTIATAMNDPSSSSRFQTIDIQALLGTNEHHIHHHLPSSPPSFSSSIGGSGSNHGSNFHPSANHSNHILEGSGNSGDGISKDSLLSKLIQENLALKQRVEHYERLQSSPTITTTTPSTSLTTSPTNNSNSTTNLISPGSVTHNSTTVTTATTFLLNAPPLSSSSSSQQTTQPTQQQLSIIGHDLINFDLQLWEVPSQLIKPVFIVNSETFRVIGCNEYFRKMCRYSLQAMRDAQFTMFQLIPSRNVPIWNLVCQWLGPGSSVKYMESTEMIIAGDNQEICLHLKRRFEDGYIYVECEPAPVYTDSLRVDEVFLPATMHIPCNASLQPIQTPPPSVNYEKLLEVLYQKKLKLNQNQSGTQFSNNSHSNSSSNSNNTQVNMHPASVHPTNVHSSPSPGSVTTNTTSFTSQMLDMTQPHSQSGVLTQQSLFNTIELNRNETEDILHRYSLK